MSAPRSEDVSRNPKVQALIEQAVKLALEAAGYRVERATVGGVECRRVIRPEGGRR